MPETRGGLITRAQGRANLENDGNVSPALWQSWALHEMRAAWRLLARINPDHFTAGPTSFTLTNPTDTYALSGLSPTFWRVRAVDFQVGSKWAHVDRWGFVHRNGASRRFRQMGGALIFTPRGEAAGTYRIWYIPEPTAFVDDNSQIDLALSMYDELIVLKMARRALVRQKKPHVDVDEELRDLITDVTQTAQQRDGSPQERVIDVYDGAPDDFVGWG